jgi:hypothetical protein
MPKEMLVVGMAEVVAVMVEAVVAGQVAEADQVVEVAAVVVLEVAADLAEAAPVVGVVVQVVGTEKVVLEAVSAGETRS